MRISPKMEELFNLQINKELESSNLYLAMASYFLEVELPGFANFFIVQAEEEQQHMMKQFRFLHDVGGRLKWSAMPAPQQDFDSPQQVFELALSHEESVTRAIYHMVDSALAEKDFASYTFLEWFVKEQVEEESLVRQTTARLRMIGDNKAALVIMDAELGKRQPGTSL